MYFSRLSLLFEDLDEPATEPAHLLESNQSARKCSRTEIRKLEYVSIRQNFVKDVMKRRPKEIEYYPPELKTSDSPKEPLFRQKFQRDRAEMDVLKSKNERGRGVADNVLSQ